MPAFAAGFRYMQKLFSHTLLMLLVLLPAACGGVGKRSADSDSTAVAPAAPSLEERAAVWADSCVRAMSLQLRVGQLFMPAVFTRTDEATLALISDYADRLGVGGIVLLKGDAASAAGIADSVARLAPAGLFVAVDAETGLSMRFDDAPSFIWNADISGNADTAALYDYGREVARECRLTGINMVLGPVLDVAHPADSHRQLRSFGSDPERVAELGVAYARGLEAGGVISVAKHFPGHGAASADSHIKLARVSSPRDTLLLRDLLPFRRYVDAGLAAVMVGHIYARALDSVERPATFSPNIISGLLRRDLRFSGLVLTDALNMGGASDYTPSDALRAGADIVMAPLRTERAIASVVDDVEKGRLPESIVNEACRRVLYYKYLWGICRSLSPAVNKKSAADLRRSLGAGADTVRSRLR